ncbi:hypothetical protein LCGC14_2800170, partial [marine sediment metagenome]
IEEIAERGAKIRRGRAGQHCNEDAPPPYEPRVVSTAALATLGEPSEPLELMDE